MRNILLSAQHIPKDFFDCSLHLLQHFKELKPECEEYQIYLSHQEGSFLYQQGFQIIFNNSKRLKAYLRIPIFDVQSKWILNESKIIKTYECPNKEEQEVVKKHLTEFKNDRKKIKQSYNTYKTFKINDSCILDIPSKEIFYRIGDEHFMLNLCVKDISEKDYSIVLEAEKEIKELDKIINQSEKKLEHLGKFLKSFEGEDEQY